jgi:putative intracellular protease/amidase
VANPDFLRVNDDAVAFVHDFFEQGKPVGVICTSVSTRSRLLRRVVVVAAGLVSGRHEHGRMLPLVALPTRRA